MPTRIVVLFNLRDGVSAGEYERWAKRVDLPTVNSLKSINRFEVFKSAGLLGSEAKPPYAYIEIIDVGDMDQFGKEVATEAMKKVAGQFQEMADNPLFIMTDKLS